MPELPEVEHARRTLEQSIVRAHIDRAKVHDARILDDGTKPAAVVRTLTGTRVVGVQRRGKWLRIELDSGGRVFSHLGMTGKWVAAQTDDATLPFEKIRLDVSRAAKKTARSRSVRYVDPRLFGRFVICAPRASDPPTWTALGPDPFLDGIDLDELHAKLARRKLPIKPTLLDQTVLAGVGNIHATEALFTARIDPRRPARDLSRKEIAALARAITRSIAKTIALQEGPVIQYVEEAGAENPFLVYGHEGTPCPRCRRPLAKMVLAGRGTVFCPHCQH